MRAWLLLVCLTAAACGSSPTAPTATPPPAATPAPTPAPVPPPVVAHAVLVSDGAMRYDAIPPQYDAWTFTGSLRNTGKACATHVSGMIDLVGNDGIIGSRAWSLATALVVHPGDRVPLTGCCFSTNELDHGTNYTLRLTMDEMPCE